MEAMQETSKMQHSTITVATRATKSEAREETEHILVVPEPLQPHPPKKCSACCRWPVTGGIVGRSYWLCGHRRPKGNPNGDPSFLSRADDFQPCCLLGPNWGCFFGTQLLVLVPAALFFAFVAPYIYWAIAIPAGIFTIVTIALHCRVGCANPGILLKQTAEAYQESAETPSRNRYGVNMSHCRYCNVLRPVGTRHCAECDVCIVGLDHHCPYMGKCVAKNNMCAFKAYNAFIMILGLYLAVVSVLGTRIGSRAYRRRLILTNQSTMCAQAAALHFLTDFISDCTVEFWSWWVSSSAHGFR